MKFLCCVCWRETLTQTNSKEQKQHTHKWHKNVERLVFVSFMGVRLFVLFLGVRTFSCGRYPLDIYLLNWKTTDIWCFAGLLSLNPYRKIHILKEGSFECMNWYQINWINIDLICFFNPALAAACVLTGLYDESHTTNITNGLFAGSYTASALWVQLTISQPSSLHVALTPSAGFCVCYSNFNIFNHEHFQLLYQLIFLIRLPCHCNQHDCNWASVNRSTLSSAACL